jgi:uncharacterized membrane protein YbhN (UPF0104 family)
VFAILGLGNNGLILSQYLKGSGIKMKIMEWLSLSVLAAAGNQLLFRGGAITKAFYLKKTHAFAISRFLPIMGAQLAITIFTVGVLGAAGVLCLFAIDGHLDPVSLTVFSSAILAPAGIITLTPSKLPAWLARNRFIGLMFDSWKTIRKERSIFRNLVGLTFLNIMLYIARMYCSFIFTGSGAGFLEIYLISLLGILSDNLGFVPGGIGVRELVVGLSNQLYGGSIQEGVVASVLDHAVLVMWALMLGGIALIYLVGFGSKKVRSDL